MYVARLLYYLITFLYGLLSVYIGGWSNNPTAQQFRHIFKRLVSTRFDELPNTRGGSCQPEPGERNCTLSVSTLLEEHRYNTIMPPEHLPPLCNPALGNISGIYLLFLIYIKLLRL